MTELFPINSKLRVNSRQMVSLLFLNSLIDLFHQLPPSKISIFPLAPHCLETWFIMKYNTNLHDSDGHLHYGSCTSTHRRNLQNRNLLDHIQHIFIIN